jgi:hypothetical protein
LNLHDPLTLTEAHKRCNIIINYLSIDRNDVRDKDRIRLKVLLHGNNHQPMHQSLSRSKLIVQASGNYRKKRKTDDSKKICIYIVVEKIIKLEIAI